MYDPLALDLQRTTQQRIRHNAERITVRSSRRTRGRRAGSRDGDGS